MSEESDDAARVMRIVERHLDEAMARGLSPVLVVMPSQMRRELVCRFCDKPSETVSITVLGRAVGTAYPYSISIVCPACMGSPEMAVAFLDRMERRYLDVLAAETN